LKVKQHVNAITVYKQNYAGESVLQYSGEILERGQDWVCLRAVFSHEAVDLGLVVFRPGDVFIEWFYGDRWYNIFQIYDGDSQRLKGWYCNITRPAVITECEVWADDMELDVLVMPNGTMLLLDEKAFGELDIPMDERMAALRAVETLRRAITGREKPFDVTRVDMG
jgi:predicted RNA-binding protein associated with RNAse of E/G family